MSKRKVIKAVFHDMQVVLPGAGGNLPKTLPSPSKNLPLLDMEEGEHGIEISIGGTNQRFVVPYANTQIYFTTAEAAEGSKPSTPVLVIASPAASKPSYPHVAPSKKANA